MTIAHYTNDAGFVFTVYDAGYTDFGLQITAWNGEEILNNPHVFSCESYGRKPADGLDWEDCERLEADLTCAELIDLEKQVAPIWQAWNAEDWIECLINEADDLLDAYLPHERFMVCAMPGQWDDCAADPHFTTQIIGVFYTLETAKQQAHDCMADHDANEGHTRCSVMIQEIPTDVYQNKEIMHGSKTDWAIAR